MKKIDVKINNKLCGELHFNKQTDEYIFNYRKDNDIVSLIMPYKNSSYIWKKNLHPIFDMNMPEGYLFELLKQYITKEYGYIDDYLIFSYLCSNIQSRLSYESWLEKNNFISIDLQEVLRNDTNDTFNKLVKTFLNKNAISGVQPKTLALLEDKESFTTKEYIIKTWGEEYTELSLNEYFCLKTIEKTGIPTVSVMLSKHNKFLIVERFNYDQKNNTFLGFEEVLGLVGKNRDEKYSGSYELVAKVLYSVCTDKLETMKNFFTLMVMNYFLKNGDAHLKNFGILYDENKENISMAPVYDVVTTTPYFYKDRPALTMFGKKVWLGKNELIKFGTEKCYLSIKDADMIYTHCQSILRDSISKIESYIISNPQFQDIGQKMIDSWSLSLDEKTYKEIPDAVTRNWE